MVRITERATVALQDLLMANDAAPDVGVRLTPDGRDSLGMVIDEPHKGDEVIRNEQTPVLIVDTVVANHLTDMVIDYPTVEDDHQTPGGFVLRSPEEQE